MLHKHHTSDVWTAYLDGDKVLIKDKAFFEALTECTREGHNG